MTPGPVERKFAKRLGFSWLEIGPQSFATGMTAEDLDQAVEAVNATHESAIAEAVKAQQEKDAAIIKQAVSMAVADTWTAAVERCAKALCDYCRDGKTAYFMKNVGWVHGPGEGIGWTRGCDAEKIRAQAQGATHG